MDGLTSRYLQTLSRFEVVAAPLADLVIRIVIFRVFFWSGLVKIRDWDSTLQLFELEYMVPILPIGFAAVAATVFELGASSLILVGLATRFAAIPLFVMTCVIQFGLGSRDPAYNQLEHYLWMAMLLSLILRGGGRFSLDGVILWMRKITRP